ncbi:ABC transporter ATP-binding protein [Crossiella cryophila]|uniref:ABC-2 type transport system ATP-binding protein n=1 Tax=Crossiella cryophila TaxID=43355 RepID=A0A7W7CIS6_9PSEU|nr:ABC transporter ATP-binding protein [Crossiella cryophila]MBB4680209.1 ABC-2 type transport system ATP-binding protein [Crossiella cryophila]
MRYDNPPALALRGLVKQFGDSVAVAGIDLAVATGTFHGLVGPNGAGKTTTLSMAVGLLRPSAGTATVGGVDVWRDPVAAKRRIGMLPESTHLFDRLTGPELLTYNGVLRGLAPDLVRARSAQLIEVLGLGEAGRKLVVDYSTGMKKKIGLACALLHTPTLLVLDEPFEAVDPVSAGTIRELLRRYLDGGGTVIFSTHVMEVAEQLCDRVTIIGRGRVLANGTLDQVRGGRPLHEVFVNLVGGPRGGTEALSWLGDSSR